MSRRSRSTERVVVHVILPRSLVSLIPGTVRSTEVEATTVREAIDRLDEQTPGLRNRLVDSGPVLREHINVFVDGDQASLETPLRPNSTVHVIPAVSGG
ncbi:MAG: MoaD/ThiS family protein [Chloroflexi bacterium]|nr:MoaD/ThiS family protein [Chloroflexota bacterium]